MSDTAINSTVVGDAAEKHDGGEAAKNLAECFVPCEGGICAAKGISAAGIAAGFRKDPHRKDLALVVADHPCVAAATFTQNRFCAAPVTVSRLHLSDGWARAVILNSGNANAATGEPGLEIAEKTAALTAEYLGCDSEDVLVASTGVIGVQLSFEHFETGIPAAVAVLDHSAEAAHDAATAVMTTDTVAKESAYELIVPLAPGETASVHVGGFVKGSGMIEPHMATMLAVIATDAPLTHAAATQALRQAVRESFNKVTVDSDTSTNDSCYLFATGSAFPGEVDQDHPAYPLIARELQLVCEDLAKKIAADGEGSTRLITVTVSGAPDNEAADTVARAIANSPLVKTAVFGHDANWGRVAAAAGKCGVLFNQEQVDIDFMGVRVCSNGLACPMDEADMLRRFENPEITIDVDLHCGCGKARIWTCDLTHDYVSINGDYRT